MENEARKMKEGNVCKKGKGKRGEKAYLIGQFSFVRGINIGDHRWLSR